MFTAILVLILVVFTGDALYSRARLSLRRRAVAAQPVRPAWDLVQPLREGWHSLGDGQPRSADDSQQAEGGDDLGRLFGQGRSQTARPDLGDRQPGNAGGLFGGRS
jgi:hypothetical protein